MFGTTGGWGVRGPFDVASEVTDGVLFAVCVCPDILLIPSGIAVGRGGGKGDIEMQVVDAVWGRYARKDLNAGRDITCYQSINQYRSL